MRPDRPSLLLLFITFAKIGAVCFGGGYSILPLLQRDIVDKYNWTSNEELVNYFAIGQCTPGIIAVNTATFIGYKTRRIPGGIVSTLGLCFPSVVIIIIIAGLITAFSDNIYVQKAFSGIRVCVCVLIACSVIKLWKNTVTDRLTFTIFLIVTAASLFLKISPAFIIIADIAFALIFHTLKMHFAERTGRKDRREE